MADCSAQEGPGHVSSPPVHVSTLPSLSAERNPLQDASGHLSTVGHDLRALFSPRRRSCSGNATLSFAAVEEATLQLPFRSPAGLPVDRCRVFSREMTNSTMAQGQSEVTASFPGCSRLLPGQCCEQHGDELSCSHGWSAYCVPGHGYSHRWSAYCVPGHVGGVSCTVPLVFTPPNKIRTASPRMRKPWLQKFIISDSKFQNEGAGSGPF